MRKNTINFWLDLASMVLLVALAITGLLMAFILPPGSGGSTLWGLGRHGWGDVHFWLAAALLILVVFHLALHWSWIVCTVRRLNPWRGTERVQRKRHDTAWGVLALVLLAAGLWAFVAVGKGQVVTTGMDAAEHAEEHAPATRP